MKHIFILLLCILLAIDNKAQILGQDEDINKEEFTFQALNELDARMAIELTERKIKTLLAGAANTVLSAVPLVGTEGVQQEMLQTNIRMDELITLNKNYNYKLMSALGNILKITKEARDGTIAKRAENMIMKAKVIKQAADVIHKTERLKKSYEILSENGWRNSDMIRTVIQLDALMKKVEELTQILIDIWKSADYQQQKKKLEETQEKLSSLEEYLDGQVIEIDEVAREIYTNKLNDEITRGYFSGIYNFEHTKEEALAKYNSTVTETKSTLIAMRNFYWALLGIMAFIAAIGYVFKLYTSRDNIISTQIVYWALTLAIAAFLGVLLEFI